MSPNKRVLLLVGLVATLVAAGLFYSLRMRQATSAALLARLPAGEAAILAIDVKALRQSGILPLLAGPTVDAEPEYKTFVAKTGFEYSRDLDAAYVSFHSTGVYFLLRGRFDWTRLEAYARESGGSCFNTLCRMQGSQPDRKISYFPLQSSIMALAVGRDEWAASRLSEQPKPEWTLAQTMQQPMWLYLPSALLRRADNFPSGTQLFARALQDAESVLLGVGAPQNRIEVTLTVVCQSEREAAVITSSLQRITKMLGEIIAKEKQKPNPRDLSGVLTAGSFQQEGRQVLGRWPIERVFVESLAGKN